MRCKLHVYGKWCSRQVPTCSSSENATTAIMPSRPQRLRGYASHLYFPTRFSYYRNWQLLGARALKEALGGLIYQCQHEQRGTG